MILSHTITVPVLAFVCVGAALVVIGWSVATTWPLLRLRRLRTRNLRIVADLRRLTGWIAPEVPREPGNWAPDRWSAPLSPRLRERAGTSRRRPDHERLVAFVGAPALGPPALGRPSLGRPSLGRERGIRAGRDARGLASALRRARAAVFAWLAAHEVRWWRDRCTGHHRRKG